jgi:ribosomal protein S18 acetylase RimI-like enzyme
MPAGYSIRPAEEADKPAVAAFTENTFSWGDYVADSWEKWLAEPAGMLLVAHTADTGAVVGVVNAVIVAAGQAWLEGARVHPEHRRRGIADDLNRAAVAWARSSGASIARLGVEAANEAPRRQVERLGYRPAGRFVYAWAQPDAGVEEAERPPGVTFPPDRESVRLATAADAADVARKWRASEARRASGGLAARGWRWSTYGLEELMADARAGRVLVHPAGLGVLDLGEEEGQVRWLDGPAALPLARAALLAARAVGCSRVLAIVPEDDASSEALVRAGFSAPTGMVVYELPIAVVA